MARFISDPIVNVRVAGSFAEGTVAADVAIAEGETLRVVGGQLVSAVWPSAGGAPSDAQYLVLLADGTLTNERVFTLGNGLDAVDAGAGGTYTVSVDETELDHSLLANLTTGDPHTQYQLKSEKSQANGYASLNSSGFVPVEELGVGFPSSSNFLRGDGSWQVPAAGITSLGGLTAATQILARVDDTNVTLAIGSSVDTHTFTVGWTGQLGISRGGTGQATALAAFDALSPLTTKGDVLTRSASNNARLAVGTNGQILSADSAEATGLKWIDAPSAGDLEAQIYSLMLAVSSSTSSITGTPDDLDWDTLHFNVPSSGVWSGVIAMNPERLGVDVDGVYRICANVTIEEDSTTNSARFKVYLTFNDIEIPGTARYLDLGAGGIGSVSINYLLDMEVSDYVTVEAVVVSGSGTGHFVGGACTINAQRMRTNNVGTVGQPAGA